MEIKGLIKKWLDELTENKSKEWQVLLQQQQYLLHNGNETIAELINITAIDEKFGSMRPVEVFLKINNKKGSFIYTSAISLLASDKMPKKGEMLRIKYFPEDLSSILILESFL